MIRLRFRYPYFFHIAVFFVFLFLCPRISAAAIPSTSTFDLRTYRGKNLLLFLYSIDDPRVDEAVQLMKELYAIRHEYNFDITGFSLDPEKAQEVMQYNQNNRIPFPLYLDHNKLVYSRLKMKGSIGFYIFNKQGKFVASKLGISTPQNVSLADNWRGYASKFLKISYIPADKPVLGIKPPVPLFSGKTLKGDTLNIKNIYTEKPVVIVFFSPNCSHCKDELAFLNTLYSGGDLKGKLEIVAISILNDQTTAAFINQHQYPFPVIADADKKITALFPSYTGSIPLSFVVDQTGSITSLHMGFDDYLRDVYVMELKKLAGLPNPPLLLKNGYSGEMRCQICHEKEHIQWELTRHADAFISLVRKGEEENSNCITCHVTGFGQGGYDVNNKKQIKYFEGVQCESCHGKGSETCSAFSGSKPKKKNLAEWEKLCLSCHTEKESINFNFAQRFPRTLHSNVPEISKMSREERLKFMESYRRKKNIFDNPAQYVGAASCRDCHSEEYSQWEKTAHARVHETSKAKSAPPEKLFRYNTGVGSSGGYPELGREGVQCESCHGPGERHLKKPEAKGHEYIVGLGAECSNCVVEQICRRCHSLNDDPEFNFEKSVEEVKHKKEVDKKQQAKGKR